MRKQPSSPRSGRKSGGSHSACSNCPMALTRIEQRRTTDEVYQSLRQAILTRVFAPGQRLNVEDLAGNLGVSFTPVRQALQLLAAEGLIVIQPRSGTYVATLSARD